MSVWTVVYSKDKKPSLGINVTSGCYLAPEGQTVLIRKIFPYSPYAHLAPDRLARSLLP